MATHGYIQIGRRSGNGYDRISVVEAVHDGYRDDLFRELIEGLVQIRQYFLTANTGRPSIMRNAAQRCHNVAEMRGYIMSLIPLDDVSSTVISGLMMNSPFQFQVVEVLDNPEGFRNLYGDVIVEVPDERLPKIHISNVAAPLENLFDENPRWLHELIRKHFPLNTQSVTYKDGVVNISLDIYLALAHWVYETVSGKKDWNIPLDSQNSLM